MTALLPPVAYQGGKQRLAGAILDRIDLRGEPHFYDLCCGSGAVALALAGRGYPVARITMLDAGPWGLFWQAIGDGTFRMERFRARARAIPRDLRAIKAHMVALAREPVGDDAAEVYPLLQAAAFGGKAIWIRDGRWQNFTARDYWTPTATSSRRSPVNPLMPMPDTLVARVGAVAARLGGVRGIHGRVETLCCAPGSVAYLDPPYGGTTAYGDTVALAATIAHLGTTVYVSEGRALSPVATQLATGRAKGGISGNRAVAPHEEWLSRFEA